MRKIQYASASTHTAYMSSDFAVKYAVVLFGQDAVDALPRISRGKRKGAIKGILTWSKCDVGGWVRSETGGHVQLPGFVEAYIETVSVSVGYYGNAKVTRHLHTTCPTYEKKLAMDKEQAVMRAKIEALRMSELLSDLNVERVKYEDAIANAPEYLRADFLAVFGEDLKRINLLITSATDAANVKG